MTFHCLIFLCCDIIAMSGNSQIFKVQRVCNVPIGGGLSWITCTGICFLGNLLAVCVTHLTKLKFAVDSFNNILIILKMYVSLRTVIQALLFLTLIFLER